MHLYALTELPLSTLWAANCQAKASMCGIVQPDWADILKLMYESMKKTTIFKHIIEYYDCQMKAEEKRGLLGYRYLRKSSSECN